MGPLALRIRILMMVLALFFVVMAISQIHSGALLNPKNPVNQILGLTPPAYIVPATR